MIEYSRRDWKIAALVSLLLFVIGACTLTPGITTWGDDHAAYINEGIAIAEGRFQEQAKINYFYHPSDMPEEAKDGRLVYAWGYPLLLSVVYRVVGFDRESYSSIIWYKMIPLLSLSLTGGVLTLLLRRRFSLYVSGGAALVFCMSGELFEAVNTLYSDLQFLFFSILTLLLMECYTACLSEDGGKRNRVVWLGILYGLSMWMTYETRLSGFTVCAVAVVGHAVRLCGKQQRLRREDLWLHLLPYIVLIVLVVVSEHLWLAPATPNISDIGKAAEKDILLYYRRMIFDYFDGLPKLPFRGTGWIFLAACVVGLVIKGVGWENIHLTLLLVGTLIVNLNLPYTNGQRYLFNVLPFMVMYSLYGFGILEKLICRIWKGMNGTAGRIIAIAFGLEILFFSCANQVYRAGYNISHWGESYSYDVYSDEAKEVYRYIREELPAEVVVAFGKPRAIYLNTQHMSYKAGVNGHEIDEADYYLKHKTIGFEDVEVNTDGYEAVVENDFLILYKVPL